jgi:hypothetical protein
VCVADSSSSLAAFDALIELGADTGVVRDVFYSASTGDERFPLLHAVAANDDVALARRLLALPRPAILPLLEARMPTCGSHSCVNSGATALHTAATYNRRRSTQLRVAAGADAGARDASGATPLLRAVSKHSYRAAKALVAAGAADEPAVLARARERAAAALAAAQAAGTGADSGGSSGGGGGGKLSAKARKQAAAAARGTGGAGGAARADAMVAGASPAARLAVDDDAVAAAKKIVALLR